MKWKELTRIKNIALVSRDPSRVGILSPVPFKHSVWCGLADLAVNLGYLWVLFQITIESFLNIWVRSAFVPKYVQCRHAVELYLRVTSVISL